jgi:hypothetical protein
VGTNADPLDVQAQLIAATSVDVSPKPPRACTPPSPHNASSSASSNTHSTDSAIDLPGGEHSAQSAQTAAQRRESKESLLLQNWRQPLPAKPS